MEPFAVRIDHHHALPGRTLAWVSGEIDIVAAPKLFSVALVAGAYSRDVVFDLGAVSFIDRAGVASLVDAKRTLERRGQYLFLRRVPPSVQRVMDLLDLNDAFTIHA